MKHITLETIKFVGLVLLLLFVYRSDTECLFQRIFVQCGS